MKIEEVRSILSEIPSLIGYKTDVRQKGDYYFFSINKGNYTDKFIINIIRGDKTVMKNMVLIEVGNSMKNFNAHK